MKDITKNETATTPTVATAKPKFAHAGSGLSISGGSNPNLKISIGADADAEYSRVPQQCRHIYQLLVILGGTATLQQLADVGLTNKAIDQGYGWRVGEDSRAPNVEYRQEVFKVFDHYQALGLCGNKVSKPYSKTGVIEFFKVEG
tara:strand:+ start:102 stop:536 length:435 start_codon:yes stop_codon:yes gene_type:complete